MYGPSQYGASASQAAGPLQFARSPSAHRENRAQHPSAAQAQSCESVYTAWQSVRASHTTSVITVEHAPPPALPPRPALPVVPLAPVPALPVVPLAPLPALPVAPPPPIVPPAPEPAVPLDPPASGFGAVTDPQPSATHARTSEANLITQ
jgi:hypothetical protein